MSVYFIGSSVGKSNNEIQNRHRRANYFSLYMLPVASTAVQFDTTCRSVGQLIRRQRELPELLKSSSLDSESITFTHQARNSKQGLS